MNQPYQCGCENHSQIVLIIEMKLLDLELWRIMCYFFVYRDEFMVKRPYLLLDFCGV